MDINLVTAAAAARPQALSNTLDHLRYNSPVARIDFPNTARVSQGHSLVSRFDSYSGCAVRDSHSLIEINNSSLLLLPPQKKMVQVVCLGERGLRARVILSKALMLATRSARRKIQLPLLPLLPRSRYILRALRAHDSGAHRPGWPLPQEILLGHYHGRAMGDRRARPARLFGAAHHLQRIRHTLPAHRHPRPAVDQRLPLHPHGPLRVLLPPGPTCRGHRRAAPLAAVRDTGHNVRPCPHHTFSHFFSNLQSTAPSWCRQEAAR